MKDLLEFQDRYLLPLLLLVTHGQLAGNFPQYSTKRLPAECYTWHSLSATSSLSCCSWFACSFCMLCRQASADDDIKSCLRLQEVCGPVPQCVLVLVEPDILQSVSQNVLQAEKWCWSAVL